MKKVKMSDIRSNIGATISREVYFKGFLLVDKGEIISPDLAERLHSLSEEIPFIYIELPLSESKPSSLSSFLVNELYNKVQVVMKNYSFDGLDDVNTVSEIMESIISGLISNNCYLDIDIDSLLIQQPDICSHSLNTAILSSLLAIKSYKFQRWLIEQITLGALLHDIGCAEIISKEGVPWEEIPLKRKMEHCVIGYKLLEKTSYIADSVKKIVLMHHVWERPEDSYSTQEGVYRSYPSSLDGRVIPKEAKTLSVSIVQTVDSFERLTNKGGKKKEHKKKAIAEIFKDTHKIYGEGAVLLARYISPYAVGDTVKLNNGHEAVVVKHTSSPSNPIVRYLHSDETVNLSKKSVIKILD